MSKLEYEVRKTLDNILNYTEHQMADSLLVVDRDSTTLVFALGDSWTWGDSLSDRKNEIYGKLISDHYDADFVNLGCRGYSNSWILMCGIKLLETLQAIDQYEKIYILITLTENGRDIATTKSFDLDKWIYDSKLVFTNDIYQRILDYIEEYWTNQIKEMVSLRDDRFSFFIGQNFVWHDMYEKLTDLSPKIVISDYNWIEVIGDYCGLSRPTRTNLVTGWIFDQVDLINTSQPNITITDLSVYQEYITPFIEKAILVNKWLDESPMNYKKASKHPNRDAHRLWANHIIEKLYLLDDTKLETGNR